MFKLKKTVSESVRRDLNVSFGLLVRMFAGLNHQTKGERYRKGR